MIIQNKRTGLNKEGILSKITEYDIYRHYVGAFPLNQAFKSPLRKDRHPSFCISYKDGSYFHNDFGGGGHSGDCFDFVMQKFNINYDQALVLIDNDFNLGISGRKQGETPVYEQPETPEKPTVLIQVEPKQFTQDELRYWASYYQGVSELQQEQVYSVGKIYIDKTRFTLPDNNMVFAYLYEDKYWKIYRPLLKGKGKWISSVPLKVVDGLKNITNCKNAVVSKSKKDAMCLRLILPSVCSVQNESLGAFSDDTVTWLRGETRGNVYVAFDSDEVGVKRSWEVTSKFSFKHLNVPYSFLGEGIKDFAELVRVYGITKLRDYLQEKQII